MVKEIFRNYDIRGIYGTTLHDQDALLIGKAFGSALVRKGAKACAVGHDNRLSSPALYSNYREGLLSTGINVIELGECLTPLVKFYVYEKNIDAGTSLTASHNDAEYNGFKLMLKKADPFFGNDVAQLYESIVNGDFISGQGSIIAGDDLMDLYTAFLSRNFNFKGRGLKVSLNCGNGTAGNFAPAILRNLGVEVIEVNCTSDGSFPNGAPDPERHDFMQVLEERVIHEKCDIGIGLDGDSDRFGLVDERGTHYESDKLMMLLAKYLLPINPGGLICCDVKCSSSLLKVVSDLGGNARIIKTGYPYHIPEAQNEALFSGELSGHFFMGRKIGFYGLDDGIVSACMMLKVYGELRTDGVTFGDLLKEFPMTYHTAEVKVNCPDDVKMGIIDNIVGQCKENTQVKDVLTIDGVRGSTSGTGWFLLRASNTSPYIVARVEGADQNEVDSIKLLVKDLLDANSLSGNIIEEAPVYFS